jgi:hypothetical protein
MRLARHLLHKRIAEMTMANHRKPARSRQERGKSSKSVKERDSARAGLTSQVSPYVKRPPPMTAFQAMDNSLIDKFVELRFSVY